MPTDSVEIKILDMEHELNMEHRRRRESRVQNSMFVAPRLRRQNAEYIF